MDFIKDVIKIGKIIKNNILLFLSFILGHIEDILILGGFGIFITALFLFVSNFAGMIGLSVVMILIGLVLSKIPKNNKR